MRMSVVGRGMGEEEEDERVGKNEEELRCHVFAQVGKNGRR